ncbi:RhoGEF [Nesidiocoris tenuis]|uniref:RhoGEF n=2 Tax=Nesidiocoris tenuis TaxID=355587 RepID=A0ABN7AUH6_9HEMI|nr:RhoGEF [Nesidiocoris tenuis]
MEDVVEVDEPTENNCHENPMECSDVEEDSEKINAPDGVRICLVGATASDESIKEAAKGFNVPVECSEDGAEWLDSPEHSLVFVLEEFSGPVFDSLKERGHRILGPTALKELAQQKGPLPENPRPTYCLCMKGVVACFTGFREKKEMNHLIFLVHNMGGSVRKEVGSKMTHLIANCVGGEKYRYASLLRLPIMSVDWVHNSWAMRTQIGFNALNSLAENRLKPFHGARVCFAGFAEDERKHMAEILVENGGTPTDIEDPACSHVVVDESTTSSAPTQAPSKAYIVKAEWFWASVQNEACVDEKEHIFQETVGRLTPRVSIGSTPGSTRMTSRKRKRLASRLLSAGGAGLLASGGAVGTPVSPSLEAQLKRRSSVSDSTLLSCSGSFLDATPHSELDEETETECAETPKKNLSARHQVFLELLQTESNYVGILNTIMTLFKAALEDMMDGEDQLLNATELRIIFGNLPPIYQVHCQMLETLKHASQNWTEEVSIGKIFLKFAPDFEKAYPPFVNFFENTREELLRCDSAKPRFHAFLKARQTRPECGRQSLQELLIRPVQRLPSISLLLKDILKHTNKNNTDYSALENALSAIGEVMTHINEDKRKTEGQMVMFDIFNEIVSCPAHLVSSHRSFVARCDVVELSDSLSGRGDHLVLFVFSDVIEICKKRSKVFNSIKSPNTPVASKPNNHSNGKPYKHVKLMSLATIRKVIDVRESEDCRKVFALMCRSTQDLKEKLYSFSVVDEDLDKMSFLKTLCRHTANNAYRADAETFLFSVDDASLLDIETSDVGLGTLSKAFKFASRTRMKVGRALSFNKTPSKLKRAMSTMMSPFGSTTNLTPASQLAQMRLASCTNINTL